MWIPLPCRGLICVSGEDRVSFLQGLLTQDIRLTERDGVSYALYSGALNAQGRLLFDMFIVPVRDALWLDIHHLHLDACITHLKRYQLRQQVEIIPCSDQDYSVWAHLNEEGESGQTLPSHPGHMTFSAQHVMYKDPRYDLLGWRMIRAEPVPHSPDPASADDYERLRLTQGIPDVADWDTGKAMPLEVGLGDLNGISWSKGCYVGQELTTRTKHQGVIRKRLLPISWEDATPETLSITQDNVEVGSIRSTFKQQGLAMLRLEAVQAWAQEGVPLYAGTTPITPSIPVWHYS